MTVNVRQHIAAAFFAIAIVGPAVWMLIDRDPPYVREWGEITPKHPAPGDYIAVQWRLRAIRNCPPNTPGNISRVIIDATGKRHTFEPTPAAVPALTRSLQLPADITPGPAVYRSHACFTCNPLHHFWPVCVTQPDLSFEVVKP